MKKAILALTICAVMGSFSSVASAAPMSGDFSDQTVRDWAQNLESESSLQHDAIIQSQNDIQALQTESGIQTVDIAKNTKAITDVNNAQVKTNQAVDKNVADIAAAKNAQVKTNQAVNKNSADIANHETRLDALEANQGYGNSFKQLKNQVDDNRKRASAGIAGVAAMANIPQVIQGQTFAVGAGVGTTDGESALAVGMSARATENIVVKASVSDDSQQNFVVGAGASYGW